jgi:DNA-binding response OmpR family regulator
LNQNAFIKSLHGKRIGLVACTAMADMLAGALNRVQSSFSSIRANSVDPAAAQLDRFDALVLGVGEESAESDWLRPEVLRKHTRPLLLAGSPEAIFCRETLQSLADDVILSPFSSDELLFRLYRITGGKSTSRETVIRSGKAIILVADDDLNIRNYLESVFKNLQVEVHFVVDGRAALNAARHLLPDLLLLDIGLPFMHGLEVLRCLRNDPGTREVPTILLTASSALSHLERAADLGVSDYIVKPFGHIDLVRKLKALIPTQSRPRMVHFDS